MKVISTKYRLSLAVLLGFDGTSWATTISVNFTEFENRENQQLAPDDEAGLVGATNWNNVAGASGSRGSLKSSDGAETSAHLTWTAGGVWGDTQANPDANANISNARLRRGFLNDNSPGISFSVSDIPFSEYNLLIYYSTDSPLFDVEQFQGATANDQYAIPDIAVIDHRWGSNPNFDSTNTVFFEGLSGNLNVQMDGRNTVGTGRGTIAGFQLIQIPEPSTPLLAGIACFAILVRRRR
jgi:hypothetical protein